MVPMGWRSGGEETQGRPWDVTTAGPSPPQPPAHGPFPPQQEALPDETEVIEDPTTEVGGPAPPQHPPVVAPTALGRATGSDTSHCGALGSPRGGNQQCFLGFFLQISIVLWKKLTHQLFQSIPRARGSSSTGAELCAPRRTRTVLFCRSLWGQTPSRWRWGSSRNPQRM